MTIKTNKKARGFYLKHLAKLDDYANGNFEDDNCYMCKAAENLSGRVDAGACKFCPLEHIDLCTGDSRFLNLKSFSDGSPECSYRCATPESIRKHIKWMEKQINDKTDCLIHYE